MNIANWIAGASATVLIGGIGIRLIMKATLLINVVEKLDATIKAAIEDHERRMHHGQHRGHQRRVS